MFVNSINVFHAGVGPCVDGWCCTCVGVESHLERLKHVQTVVNRREQQSGQDVLDRFFKALTDGLQRQGHDATIIILTMAALHPHGD